MAQPPRPDDGAPGPTLAEIAAGTVAPRTMRRAERERRREPPPPRRRRGSRRRSRLWFWLLALLGLGTVAGVAALGAAAWFLDDLGRTPREWAPYLERRASGNHGLVVAATARVARVLDAADRIERAGEPEIPPRVGASVVRSGAPPGVMARLVGNMAQLAAALAQAEPGQVIQLLPGTYRMEGRGLRMDRAGTAVAPIVLRAERLGDATLLSDTVEAFKVAGPHWVIENLVVRGVCGRHSDCEHAVHVVGHASGVVIRNNRFEDFNAQIKVNGESGAFPDHGRVEGNTLVNAAARDTKNPVTPIDLVAASHWRIADNLIADFQRAFHGAATYGAFMKGAGEGTVMERNVVLCEWKLAGPKSPTIGLSVGGGGTFPDAVKRDLGESGVEQKGGVIRDNLIAFCNDVGIYVNKGQRSVIAHNTLLDTAGIGVRFAESTAEVAGNLVDGVVQARDGALVRRRDTVASPLLGLFVGLHPVRAMFRDAARLDLRWRERPGVVAMEGVRPDLCGVERFGQGLPGAFDDWGGCRPPIATPAAAAPAGPAARPR